MINAGDVEDRRKHVTRRRTVLVAAGSSSSREKLGSCGGRAKRGRRRWLEYRCVKNRLDEWFESERKMVLSLKAVFAV